MAKSTLSRDVVFVAGGQPSVTYVDRGDLKIEEDLGRALKVPNQIVSLAGPTKTGKTVLVKQLLEKTPFVWIEGGQIEKAAEIWEKVCYTLNLPVELSKSLKDEEKLSFTAGIKALFAVEGSLLSAEEAKRTYKIDSMASAIKHLSEKSIALVIDDFHYLPAEARTAFLRQIKGPVFNGLKLILLSVTHRGNDAVRAESELQGRVTSVVSQPWRVEDLKKIADLGFAALNVKCPARIINRLADEAQGSPFLMQKLCWEVCAGIGIDERPTNPVSVAEQYDFVPICKRLSRDFGHPIYQKLEVGPQARKARMSRRLKSGGSADIYKAILMAIAATGPLTNITYDELRAKLNDLLVDDPPQKNEVTSALKHLAVISQGIGNDAGIDWDGESRKIDISDPYLRFYLRWQIRPVSTSNPRSTASIRLTDLIKRWKIDE